MAEKTKSNSVRKLTETAIMLALAVALSYVTIFKLPMGGSITLFSQVPIIIIGYRYGWKWGMGTGVMYGILEMLLQGLGNFAYVKGIVAYLILILADYVLAFMSLGLGGGMFKKIKNQPLALGLGALVASALRFVCHFISGITIWGEYADGYNRKPFTQVWSITIQSDNSEQAMNLCIKARDWLDRVGKTYLNDNGVIVQSVGAINNRDNLITIEYEYRMGFDCTMWFLNVLDSSTEETGRIETVEFNQ